MVLLSDCLFIFQSKIIVSVDTWSDALNHMAFNAVVTNAFKSPSTQIIISISTQTCKTSSLLRIPLTRRGSVTLLNTVSLSTVSLNTVSLSIARSD